MPHVYSYGESSREFPFVFPTGERAPKEERVTLWFKRAARARERELLAAIATYITDEDTRTTTQVFDSSRMDELYGECLTRVENLDLKQQDGTPADLPANSRDKRAFMQNILQGNLGFVDLDRYGSLEEELSVWFNKQILRQTGNLRKNLKTPPSDTSAESKSPAKEAASTPPGAAS